MGNMVLQVVNRTVPATFLAMSRQGIFFIPAVLIFPAVWGMLGVQLAQPVSDVLSAVIAAVMMRRFLRELDGMEAVQ